MPEFAIRDIRPNPFRHIDRYPIRRDKVAALRESFRATGFWGNVVARRRDGIAEIAYGHHRLVAATEEYGPGGKIDLIVRDLHDDTMLQIMARENMEEWGTSAAVEHETVRAVVEAYAEGKVQLPAPTLSGPAWYAPSFQRGAAEPARSHPYSPGTLAKFLGWSEDKIGDALGALGLIEQGVLSEADFEGLTTAQAGAVVTEARRAVAQRETAARLHQQQAEAAAREAVLAERRRAAAEEERKRREAQVAQARNEEAKRRAQEEAQRAAENRQRAEQERRVAERRSASEQHQADRERERGRREATTVGRTVSRELQTGRIGYKGAPAVAARMSEKKAGPPPYMDDLARRLATDLTSILDPDRDQRTQRLDIFIQYRDDLNERIRDDLVRTLDNLAGRTSEYAGRLRRGTEGPKPVLPSGARR